MNSNSRSVVGFINPATGLRHGKIYCDYGLIDRLDDIDDMIGIVFPIPYKHVEYSVFAGILKK